MPSNEFSQVFTVDLSQVEAAMNQLSAKAKAIASEALSGIAIPATNSGPSIAAQAATITTAIRRAQQLSGGANGLNKRVTDELQKAFGGSNFSGITGDPAQGARIGKLQGLIANKLNEEFAQIQSAVALRTRVNQLLTQSASSIVGRSAVSSAKIGALKSADKAIEAKAIDRQAQKALPAASDAEVSALQTQRAKLATAIAAQASAAQKGAVAGQQNAALEQGRRAELVKLQDANGRLIDSIEAQLPVRGGQGGGGGNFPPPGGTFDPDDPGDGDDPRSRINEAINDFNASAAFNELAAESREFIDARKRLRISELNLASAHTTAEAASAEFIQAQVTLRTAQNTLAANLNLASASTPDFISSQVRLITSEQTLAAAQNEVAARSPEFIQSKVRLLTSEAALEAANNAALAQSTAFIQAKTRLATSENALATANLQAQTQSAAFIQSKLDLLVAENQLEAKLLSEGAASTRVAQSKVDLAVATNREAAASALAQANSTQYIESVQQAAIAKNRLARAEELALTNVKVVESERGKLIASLKRQNAETASQLDPRVVQERAKAVVLESRLNTARANELASSAEYKAETTSSIVARNRLKQAEVQAASTTEALNSATALRTAELTQKARQNQNIADDPLANAAFAESSVAEQNRRAAESQALDQRRGELARARIIQEKTRLRQEAEFISLSSQELVVDRARLNNEKAIFSEKIKLEQLNNGLTAQLNQVRAQRIAAEQKAAKDFNRVVAAELKASGAGIFTRVRARQGAFASGRFEGGSNAGGGIGGFLGGGLLSTARFALPSAALFGGIQLIKDTVNEAEELERVLTQLEAQLEVTGQGASFEPLRDKILDIARETGNAGQEVAEFAFQLQGAFGQEDIAGVEGLDLVENQLEAISKLNRITSIDNQQVVDSITAISLAYGTLGEDVANLAVVAESKLGVSIDDTINFLGDIAPVAQEAGFSLTELTALASLSQQRSGKSGTQLAEAFGRIIPAVSGARQELIELASTNAGLNTPEFFSAIENQDIAGQIFAIANAFQTLDTSAQNQLIELLGGRREAQVLLTVLQDSDSLKKTVDDLGAATGSEFDDRFEAFQNTFGQQLAEFREQFTQLGVAFFESGIDDFLLLLLSILGDLIRAVGLVLNGFNEVDETLGGLPSKLLIILGIMKAISTATGNATILQGLSAFAGRFGPGAAASSVAATAATGTASSGLILPASARTAAAGGIATGAGASGATAQAAAGGAAIGAALALAAAAAIGSAIGISSGRSGTLLGVDFDQFLDTIGFGPDTFVDQDDLQASRENLLSKLEDATDEQLAALAEDTRSNFQKLKDGVTRIFTGVDVDISDAAGQEQNRRAAAELGETLDNITEGGGSEAVREAILLSLDELDLPGRREDIVDSVNEQFNKESAEALNAFFGRDIINTETPFARFRNDDGTRENQFVGTGRLGVNEEQLRDLIENVDIQAEIQKAVEAGDEQSLALLRIFESALNDSGTVSQAIDNAKGNQIDLLNDADKARDLIDGQTASIDEAKAAFDAGRGSFNDYLESLDNNINSLRGLVSTGNATPEDIEKLDDSVATRNKAVADFFSDQDDLAIELANLIGGDDISNIQGEIDVLVSRLNDPEFLDADARLDYANQLISLQQAFYDASIANANSAEEALAIAQAGVPVLPEVRTELIAEQIRATADNEFGSLFQDSILQLFAAGEIVTFNTADQFTNAVVGSIVAGGESLERMREIIETKIASLKNALLFNLTNGGEEFADEYNQQIQELQTALDAINLGNVDELSPNNTIIDPVTIRDQQSVEKAEKEATRAREEAAREAERAAAERERAAEEARRQAEDLARARLEYALALVAGDPVRAAQVSIQQADLAFKQAETEADKLRAQAQRIAAQRGLVEAIRDITEAQFDLLSAQAEYAGQTIEASQISLQRAQQRLSQLQSDFDTGNAGQADVIRGQADVVRAQAAARDAQLQSSLDDYAFLYEMERINKQQYISYLQSLKQIPDLTEEQIRSIDRQIKGLASELRSDFQFNLPTNLALPTLYEARRVNQGTGGGIGYQDNRNVQVYVTVNDAAATAEVEALLEYHIGNNQNGTAVKRY